MLSCRLVHISTFIFEPLHLLVLVFLYPQIENNRCYFQEIMIHLFTVKINGAIENM